MPFLLAFVMTVWLGYEPNEPRPGIPAKALPETFRIAYVVYANDRQDGTFNQFAAELFAELQKDAGFKAQYKEYDFSPIAYTQSPEKLKSKSFVAFLTPLKFIEFEDYFKSGIEPLQIVKKGNDQSAYYNAAVIVNIDSRIDSLESPNIARVFAIKPGSLSGNRAPLDLLYHNGVIARPDIGTLGKRWIVTECDTHSEVLNHIRLDKDAIGFTWYDAAATDVKPLVRYGCYPMDIVAVSRDIADNATVVTAIKTFLKARLERRRTETGAVVPGALENSPVRANGVVDFSPQFKAAIMQIRLLSSASPGSGFAVVPWCVIAMAAVVSAITARIRGSEKLRNHREWSLRRRIGYECKITLDTALDSVLWFAVIGLAGLALWVADSAACKRCVEWLVAGTTSAGIITLSAAIGVFLGVLISPINASQRVRARAGQVFGALLEKVPGFARKEAGASESAEAPPAPTAHAQVEAKPDPVPTVSSPDPVLQVEGPI